MRLIHVGRTEKGTVMPEPEGPQQQMLGVKDHAPSHAARTAVQAPPADAAQSVSAGRVAVKIKDYAAIVISLVSLCVVASGSYLTHFRQGHVQVSIGLAAHLYHPRDGGTAIYLPVHLLNDSPVKGIVRRAFLQIETSSGETFVLRWQRRSRIDEHNEYNDVAGADPFFVEGKSHAQDVFWFWWPPNEKVSLLFVPGQYTFTLWVWTNDGTSPSVVDSKKLVLAREDTDPLAERRRTSDPRTRIKPFDYSYTIGIYRNAPLEPGWWTKTRDAAQQSDAPDERAHPSGPSARR